MQDINHMSNPEQDLTKPRRGPDTEGEPRYPAPPSVEDTQPVLPRPDFRRAGDFLPEWLRRLSHG